MITDFKIYESLLKTIGFNELDTKNDWCEDVSSKLDNNFNHDAFYDDDIWVIDGTKYGIILNRTLGYVELLDDIGTYYQKDTESSQILLMTSWEENDLDKFILDIEKQKNITKYNI